jgi:hypothetical protein
MTTSVSPAVRPRFRSDLVAEPIQDGSQRFVDVFDPDSGRGFRFYEVEYSIACAMDGERDVAGLARWAREELGVDPSHRELVTVISTLGELGYLTGERADVGGLAPGVIAAAPAAEPPVEQLELGTAGGVAAARGELPRAEAFELGQAGGVSAPRIVVDDFGTGPDIGLTKDDFPVPPAAAVPVAELQRRTIPDQDHDGPTDLPRPVPLAAGDEDVSTDLSDHLAISASDVKEAVRASRVMQAVELPADIAATLAAAEAEQEAKASAEQAAAEQAAAAAEQAAAEQAAAEQAAADKAAAEQAAAVEKAAAAAEKAAADKAAAAQKAADRAAQAVVKPVDEPAEPSTLVDEAGKKPAPKAEDAATKPVPKEKDKVAAKPVEPPAEPRTSRALIALLLLTILLAGAYLVWTQILEKPLPWEKAKTAEVTRTAPLPPAPPPPPPAPSATLNANLGAPTTVAAGQQGTIVDLAIDGTAIAKGDILARFVGNPGLEKRLNTTRKRLDDLARQLADFTSKRDAATAANKPDAVKLWQDKIDKLTVTQTSLQTEVASATQQLEAFSVKAPLAGMVKTEVAKGAKITNVEQPIATITAPPTLAATFTPNPGKTYAIGDKATVVAKADTSQVATCEVTAVDGPTITVTCPAGFIAGGSDVTLQ